MGYSSHSTSREGERKRNRICFDGCVHREYVGAFGQRAAIFMGGLESGEALSAGEAVSGSAISVAVSAR